MNTEGLLAEVERQVDSRLADVLARVLSASLATPGCAKCSTLLRDYVRAKLTLHHANRRNEGDLRRPSSEAAEIAFQTREEQVNLTRTAFHAAECECGEERWRRRRQKQQTTARRMIA